MTSRTRLQADFTVWIGRSCRPNSSAPASARSLNRDKEPTERIVPAIRQDTRDLNGPQPSATLSKVFAADEAHHSTYTSQPSFVVRRALALERSQHISFPLRTLSEIQKIRSALSGPFFYVLTSLIGVLTDTAVDSGTPSRGLSVLTTHRAYCYSGANSLSLQSLSGCFAKPNVSFVAPFLVGAIIAIPKRQSPSAQFGIFLCTADD